MALVGLYGSKRALIGPNAWASSTVQAIAATTIDAANECLTYIGRIETSDGASHTINTTGSSSIQWMTNTVTFANAGTTVKVGIGAVDTANGPPGRASNVADVVTFDVAAVFTGGGGGITANAWQTSVPTTGTKTIADGDLVAVSIQMTARAGVDSILAVTTGANINSGLHRPTLTSFTGAVYASVVGLPNIIIKFSDGAYGWFSGSDVATAQTVRTFNSGSSPNEYGQLYKLPFPSKIYGVYGWGDFDGDCNVILYSDPLGTPVAEKTVSLDLNTIAATTGRRFEERFSSPYTTTADQNIAVIFKPTSVTNVSAYFKTLGHADHRASDPWGTVGYGVSRASGAFADANSSLDHYYIGLIVGALEHGVSPTYGLGI